MSVQLQAQVKPTSASTSGFTPVRTGFLQRKCACGYHTMAGGECAECSKEMRFGLQTKLMVNEPGDIYEREADQISDQVLVAPLNAAVNYTPLHIQRYVGLATGQANTAPANVDHVLTSSGRPLDPATRAFMESRFGQDFGHVRVHTDSKAAESTRAVSALAYTVGKEIIFGEGQYAPHTHQGRRLLAHELTHVVQQAHSERSLQRFSYEEFKEKAYSGLISGLRTAKKVALDALRSQVGRLPSKWWGAANTIISIIDEVLGVIQTLILAVIGLVVGFGEGVVGLVKGLITLGYGVLKLLYDLVVGIFTNFDELKQDLYAIANTLKNLPSTLKKMVTDWLDRFNKASLERQSLMIAELFGQIEALIASFAVAASRPGSVATVAEAGGEAGAAGTGATATEVISAGTQATRPTLTVIRGGGGATTTAARSSAPAFEFEGSAALKVEPLVEEAPVAVPLRLVPSASVGEAAGATLPEAASVGARSKALAGAAIAAATAAEKTGKGKKPAPLNSMRFQVQWGTGQGGPTFSRVAVAPANPGVTTVQAVTALWAAVRSVTPAAALTAAGPAAVKQQAWILSRPPAGIGPGAFSKSEYFSYLRYTDARVDVENQRGQNLRV